MGGVERYTANLAREIVKAGNKVIVVTSGIKNCPDYEEDEGITILRMPSILLLKGRFPIIKKSRKTDQLFHKLDHFNVDYVIVNTRLYLMCYAGAKYAHDRNIPSIVIEHGTGHMILNNKFLDFFGGIYEHILSRMIKKNNQDFFGVSRSCCRWLEHFKIKGKGQLYNSVDLKKIYEIYSREDDTVRSMIQYNLDDIVITFTGRLIEEKGVLKLMEAIDGLKGQYPKLKLCIAGDGMLADIISKNTNENIIFCGRLQAEQVIHLLKLSTVYCLPTEYPEGLPTSVLEAIACRVYVITSASGGAKEIISDKEFGCILRNTTVSDIKEAISYALEHPSKRAQAVENAYKRVEEEFTWTVTAKKLMHYFEGVE